MTVDSSGAPVVHYSVTAADSAMMLDGLDLQLRLMYAAGARALFPVNEHFPWFVPDDASSTDRDPTRDPRMQQYLAAVRAEGVQPLRVNCFSAHQMSSCRMSATRQDGPVRPSGETWECAGLFCADGSSLPSSLGLNPMVTIAAMGHMVARNIMHVCGVSPASDGGDELF